MRLPAVRFFKPLASPTRPGVHAFARRSGLRAQPRSERDPATGIDPQKLTQFVQKQRWFGGKSRQVASISLVDHNVLPLRAGRSNDRFIFGIAEVQYAEGKPEHYVTTLRVHRNGSVSEGLQLPEFQRALYDALTTRQGFQLGQSRVAGIHTPAAFETFRRAGARPALKVSPPTSSNTVMFAGKEVLLKLVRRIEPGVSPEFEHGQHFARSGTKVVPSLLGALELRGPKVSGMVAFANEQVPVKADGWEHLLSELRGGRDLDSLRREVVELGEATAEVHLHAANGEGDAAYRAEPLTKADNAAEGRELLEEIGRATKQFGRAHPEVSSLEPGLSTIANAYGRTGAGGLKIRIHGDYHLGQVLRTQDGAWRIIDWEGEPARPMNERRRKSTPLRDVAGMLRSFDYLGAELKRPEVVAPLRQAFLEGYFARARGKGLLPADEGALQSMLQGQLAKKTVYELGYEVNNRPDHVGVPLAGLRRLVER